MKSLKDILFPRSCIWSGAAVETPLGGYLGQAALARLRPMQGPFCPGCGNPMPIKARCGKCSVTSPYYKEISGIYPYAGPAIALMQTLKYHRGLYLRGDFFRLLEQAADRLRPQLEGAVVTWVPLHPRKLRQRGFNQAQFLTEILLSAVNPVETVVQPLLERTRFTTTQTHLHASQRLENVQGAFGLLPGIKLEAKRAVVIFDDVTTTGATLNACAEVLHKAGAQEVKALAFCHGR